MKISVAIALLSVALLPQLLPAATPWFELGGSASPTDIAIGLGNDYRTGLQSSAFDSQGRLVMAVTHNPEGPEPKAIFVSRWNGEEWEEVGEGSNSGFGVSAPFTSTSRPGLAIDSQDHITVAWEAIEGGVGEIYARRWDGVQWEDLGDVSSGGSGVSDTATESNRSKIAIDGMGRPVVAWMEITQESPTFASIFVRRWNGTLWEEMGTGSASGTGLSGSLSSAWPSLAIDDQGHPVVTWQALNNVPGGGIFVRRWTGTAWEEIDGSATGLGIATAGATHARPAIAVDSLGRICVTWANKSMSDPQWEVFVLRWSGEKWESVGPDSASGGGISNSTTQSLSPHITVDALDRPIVVYEEGINTPDSVITAWRWSGEAWQVLGTGSPQLGGVSRGAIGTNSQAALDHEDVLHVTYTSGSFRILTQRWNEIVAEWEPLESGSATHGGLSLDRGVVGSDGLNTGNRRLVFNSDGSPWVAWSDTADDLFRVRVRRWDGHDWIDVGDHVGWGCQPSLEFTSDGTPVVAWSAFLGREWNFRKVPSHIFVSQWDGTAWVALGDQSNTGRGISNSPGSCEDPTIRVNDNDDLFVVWRSKVNTPGAEEPGHIFVRQWNGTAWVEVGGNSASGTGISGLPHSSGPTMDIDPQGYPVIAWRGGDVRNTVVKRLSGSTWVQVGEQIDATYGLMSLASDPSSADLHLMVGREIWRFNNGAWSRLADWEFGISEVRGDIEVAPNGDLLVATDFVPLSRIPQIHLSTWDGVQWQDYGAETFGETSLLPSQGYSRTPDLAISPEGYPAVSWMQERNSIYLLASGPMPINGDTNLDGHIEASDVVMLRNHLNGGNVIPPGIGVRNADVNGDDTIDETDIDEMIQIILEGE